MKKLALKDRTELKDTEVIKTVMSRPYNPQAGLTLPEIRRSMKILDKLEASHNGVLLLEDSEWEDLRRRFDVFPFSVAHKDIVALADDLASAKAE